VNTLPQPVFGNGVPRNGVSWKTISDPDILKIILNLVSFLTGINPSYPEKAPHVWRLVWLLLTLLRVTRLSDFSVAHCKYRLTNRCLHTAVNRYMITQISGNEWWKDDVTTRDTYASGSTIAAALLRHETWRLGGDEWLVAAKGLNRELWNSHISFAWNSAFWCSSSR
jgi:hypothetical protein